MFRRLLLPIALSLCATTPASAQSWGTDVFDVVAAGKVVYQRTDVAPNGPWTVTTKHDVGFAFRSDFDGLMIRNRALIGGGGEGRATLSGVTGTYRASGKDFETTCSATNGQVTPGEVEDGGPGGTGDDRTTLLLRTMGDAQVDYTQCAGSNPSDFGEVLFGAEGDLGGSPLDVILPLDPAEVASDGFEKTLDFERATTGCPGATTNTASCTMTLKGTATFVRVEVPDVLTPGDGVGPAATGTTPAPGRTPAPSRGRATRPGGGCVQHVRARLRHRRVRVALGHACKAKGTVTVALPTGKRLGRERFRKGSTTVVVKLSRTQRRRARRAGTVRVTVRAGGATRALEVRF